MADTSLNPEAPAFEFNPEALPFEPCAAGPDGEASTDPSGGSSSHLRASAAVWMPALALPYLPPEHLPPDLCGADEYIDAADPDAARLGIALGGYVSRALGTRATDADLDVLGMYEVRAARTTDGPHASPAARDAIAL